jgi:hypothetical protein
MGLVGVGSANAGEAYQASGGWRAKGIPRLGELGGEDGCAILEEQQVLIGARYLLHQSAFELNQDRVIGRRGKPLLIDNHGGSRFHQASRRLSRSNDAKDGVIQFWGLAPRGGIANRLQERAEGDGGRLPALDENPLG